MMTSFAALMGTLPIALGVGAGAESRRPLGMAVVGGLLFSQVVTLYLTPVVYIYMEKLRSVSSRVFGGKRERPGREGAIPEAGPREAVPTHAARMKITT